MKKLLALTVAVVTSLAAVVPVAQAATVNSTFTVAVSLLAQCQATNSGTTTVDFGTYTAITGGASTPAPTAALTFNCTRGLNAPTVAFDTSNGTALGGGVLVGLNYGLSVGPATIAAGLPATAVAGVVGSADGYTYTVTGSMAASQAGTCTTGTCAGSHVRTLIVTY